MSIRKLGGVVYSICTSSTRPASPIAGTMIFETDTNTIQLYSGSAWVQIGPVTAAWTSFTPTLTAGATVTKTVTYAAYMRIGRTIIANVQLAITGAGTASTAVQIGLPVTATTANSTPVGSFYYQDTGTAIYMGIAYLASSTTAWGVISDAASIVNNIGAQPAFTTANTDITGYSVHYEAAS